MFHPKKSLLDGKKIGDPTFLREMDPQREINTADVVCELQWKLVKFSMPIMYLCKTEIKHSGSL